jgi:hypothetical protein
MARKRIRDWMQMVYKYAVTEAEIPESMWAQARQMQDLWNKLCLAHEEIRKSITPQTSDDERKAKWVEWRDVTSPALARAAKEAGLRQECDADILNRFNLACTAAVKDPSRGWPRPGGLKVSIAHRYSGGGVPLTTLHGRTSRRVRFSQSLSFEPGRRRSMPGIFSLNDESQIRFTAMVHRPIPAGCIVKNVRWYGRFSRAFGWSWWLAIAVEVPPTDDVRQPTGRRAAIDVGWRVRGDGIRIGYLVDDNGCSEELLLPFDFSTNQTRKMRARYGHLAHWNHLPQTHQELRELASRQDTRFDQMKAELAKVLDPLPAGFDKMRSRGIIGILHELPEGSPIRPLIEEWLAWDTPLFRMQARASQRFAQHREDLYRNLTRVLALTYDSISVEKLDIKRMIEEATQNYGLEAAKRYHQIAATGDFLLRLSTACRKHGTELKLKAAEASTATCCECGGAVTTGPNLMLTCVNGHEFDQDYNAARNLLTQAWPAHVSQKLTRKEHFEQLKARKAAREAAAPAG